MATIKIHNAETNEVIERKMNSDELAQWEFDQAQAQARQDEATQKAANKSAAQTKLAALGLTTEEAALLLRGN